MKILLIMILIGTNPIPNREAHHYKFHDDKYVVHSNDVLVHHYPSFEEYQQEMARKQLRVIHDLRVAIHKDIATYNARESMVK